MAKRSQKQPLQIYGLLPKKNCKDCGLPTCMAFAVALIRREAIPTDCTELTKSGWEVPLSKLTELFLSSGILAKNGLLVESEKCNGCGDCVAACNFSNKKNEPGSGSGEAGMKAKTQILQVVNGVLVVINWDKCQRMMEPPEYCKACEARCPFGALEMVK